MYKQITALADCYGCGVCAAVCPVEIIRFEPGAGGFYRPLVTEGEKCIDCGLCNGSCAALSHDIPDGIHTKAVYAAWSDDPDVRRTCSSGGIAYELSRTCIRSGGRVCGVKYNVAGRRAEHYVASAVDELEPMKRSKYIPSDSARGFREILATPAGTPAMITGTPCQMASMRKYLRLRGWEDRFVLMDFFCHGVPSLSLWQGYVRERDGTLGRADEVAFRDKAEGWHRSFHIRGVRNGQTVYVSEHDDIFYTLFLRNYVSERACYSCPFIRERTAADIRVGDIWGAKYASNKEGVSLVAAMSGRGEALLKTPGKVTFVPEDADEAMSGQRGGKLPVPPMREALLAGLAAGISPDRLWKKYALRMRLWRVCINMKRRAGKIMKR